MDNYPISDLEYEALISAAHNRLQRMEGKLKWLVKARCSVDVRDDLMEKIENERYNIVGLETYREVDREANLRAASAACG
jgi:hypothetical protein